MATVGKNILDNLTTGMYSDSKVIYREYIQNACDQIDLALSWGLLTSDEANVDIFGKFVSKMSENTQFIIITHKKKTMEYANVLYGVTMQESGVSKLVSVKLEDYKK